MKKLISISLSLILTVSAIAQNSFTNESTKVKEQSAKMNFGLKRKIKAENNDSREISVLVKGNVDVIRAAS